MKKNLAIALLVLLVTAFKAQQQTQQPPIDSLVKNLERRIDQIQLNLAKCHDMFEVGIALHGAGAMAGIITLTGYQQKIVNRRQLISGLMIESLFHVAGISVNIYSHKYLGKAAMNISPNKISFQF